MSALASRHRRTHPFAQKLRGAIDIRGLTLSELHRRLTQRGVRVSMGTLSYWRSGARQPEGARSMAVVAELEDLLGLPAGALSSLLTQSSRTGRIGGIHFPWSEDSLQDAAREVHEALGSPFPPPVRELSLHSVTDVGADGGVVRRSTRSLVQAASGTVATIPLLEVMPWVPIPAPTFRVVAGGEIYGTHSPAGGHVHGAGVRLSEPLTPASSTVIEHVVEFPADGPVIRETGQGVGRAAYELLLWVRFHPEALPDWCTLVEEAPDEPRKMVPVRPGRQGEVHVFRRNFGPGALGLHWGYDGDDRAGVFAPE